MLIQFEIESVFKITVRNEVYVVAKEVNPGADWQLSDSSKLGQVEIRNWFDIPRANDENGNPVMKFAFCLKNSHDKDKLKIGEIVELIP